MQSIATGSNPKVCPQAALGPLDLDILVLGLGNTLLGDDGVGVHIVRRLATDPTTPQGLRLIDGGTLGFRLIDTFASSDAVLLVDATDLGEPAGTIRLLQFEALKRHIGRCGRLSAHEAGLIDLIILARIEGCLPRRLAVLGIQPHFVDWDEGLSPAVSAALPHACKMAVDTAQHWQENRYE
jgi:hydrogenase maturation protease